MSLQNSPQTSTPANHDDFFLELDQAFQTLWSSEIKTYAQTVEQKFDPRTTQALPQPSPRRSRKARKTAQAPIAPRVATPVSPLRQSVRPVRRSRQANPAGLLKAAGVAIGVIGLSFGSYQTVRSYQQSRELPPIRQVMYQNAQTKVAAFRKELEDGEHFVSEADRPIEYIAQSGDTVAKISQKFHVSPNTIIKNNERSKVNDVIEPGTKLSILPVDGIAHPVEKHETLAELSKRYHVNVQKIVDANQLDNPHMITEKQKIIIPNATELKRRPEPKPVMAAIRASGSGQSAPVVKTRTGRRLSWPTAGIVTSGYGWRWFRMHNGMDIAGPVGTPVKAAKEGRVVYAGWMGGYGYCVDIDHGNGVTTRYGHNSALQVANGQYVYRGQPIASMGSTGHSTGPHLHFEVHINGSPIDPRGYF